MNNRKLKIINAVHTFCQIGQTPHEHNMIIEENIQFFKCLSDTSITGGEVSMQKLKFFRKFLDDNSVVPRIIFDVRILN